jgi:hypothetical protein
MPSFFNRRLSPDFIAVPHEQSAAERATTGRFSAREVVSLIDGHLADQSDLMPNDRNTELIDVLLSLRNVLTIPAIPGRPS